MEQWVQETQKLYFSGYPYIEYGVGGYIILISVLLALKCLFSCDTKHPAKFNVVKFQIPNNNSNTNTSNQQELINNQTRAVQQLNEKLITMQQGFDKLAKEHIQLRSTLSDLQSQVFDILTKKTNSSSTQLSVKSIKSQIIVPQQQVENQEIRQKSEVLEGSDQLKAEKQQLQEEQSQKTSILQQQEVKEEQQQQLQYQQQHQQQQKQYQQQQQQQQQQQTQNEENLQNTSQRQFKEQEDNTQNTIIAQPQEPMNQSQTNPFAAEQPPNIRKPQNPPTPRRIPPQLRPK